MAGMSERAETFCDTLFAFSLPEKDARGRIVRLEEPLETILTAHNYPPAISHLLGEALILSALMGGLLKGEGAQLTMQAQTKAGVVRLLVCDYRAGALRGHVDFDEAALADLGANPSLSALFGEGYLAMTMESDNGTGVVERYQGIVPLEGETLAQACENYFVQSEQVPTLIRIASRIGGEGYLAAGMLVQHLADGEVGRERLHVRLEHPDWEHVSILADTISHDELLDHKLSMDGIIWRLFHEEDEIRVQQGSALRHECRCSAEYYASVIKRFPPEERAAMRGENGTIDVDCAFCSRKYELEL